MQLKKLSEQEIATIYSKELIFDFPADEVKPLQRILSMISDGAYWGYGLYDNDRLLGYAFFVESPDKTTALLDYYAVVRRERGKGIGSFFLRSLQKELGNYHAVILESEAIESAKDEADRTIRTRRIAFYLQNGLRETAVQSLLFGVHYHIFCLDCAQSVTDGDIRHELQEIYRYMFYPKYWDCAKIFE